MPFRREQLSQKVTWLEDPAFLLLPPSSVGGLLKMKGKGNFRTFQNYQIQIICYDNRGMALSTFLLDSPCFFKVCSVQVLFRCCITCICTLVTPKGQLFLLSSDKFCEICDFANSFSYVNKCYTSRDIKLLL